MSWTFKNKLKEIVDGNDWDHSSDVASNLMLEIERISKQRCAYCDGFGHAGNDCPTDYKLAQLRVGVREQA